MKSLVTILASGLILGMGTSYAGTMSVANSQSCEQFQNHNKPFILVLKKGESVTKAISQCATDAHLNGAALSGLGAIKQLTLTYFNTTTKKYQNKIFPGVYELDSLTGNITETEGKLIPHMHVALSNDQYQMLGGHLTDATVAATAEITITPFKGHLVKKFDKDVGIDLISST